jgi:pectin methylesterase-like acyl-CoA thioesterase
MNLSLPPRTAWVKLLSLAVLGLPLTLLTTACGDDAPGATSAVGATAGSGGQLSGAAGSLALAGSAGTPGVAGSASGGAGGTAAGAANAAGMSGATTTGGQVAMGGSAGSGGSVGAGGVSGGGSGGVGGGGAGGSSSQADCNSVVGQPVLTVAASGAANFQTVQAALNSLSKTNATPTQIRIAPGTYKEKLNIQVPNVTLCGQTGKATTTILTYSDNANTSNGNGGTLGTSGGASTTIASNNVSAENLTFANTTPQGGSQAVAVLVSGDQVQFRNSRFISFQDTLYVRKAKQYFRDCYIEGTVDYIFGDATAVFQDCTAHNVSGGTAVTAPNTDQGVAYGLVFLGGQLTAASSISAGSMALGRNWGAYGAATFLRTQLGAHIKPVGWVPMGTNTLDTARFSEFQTTGAGATASAIAARASQSKQLSTQEAASYTLAKIFGAWVPSYSK